MKRLRTLTTTVLAVSACFIYSQSALAAPPTAVYSSGNVNVPVPASGTMGLMTDQVINVPDTGNIYDVNVRIRLNHTFMGDLEVSLIAPDATTIALTASDGSYSDNFGSGATDCSGKRTVFDSDADRSVIAYDPPWVGSFRPRGNLDALRGHFVNGNWTLRINDVAAGDAGALFCWQLVIARDETEPTIPVLGGALRRPVQNATRFTPGWVSSDPESGVAAYYPTWSRRPYDGAFFLSSGDLGAVRATSRSFTGVPGNTYCFSAFARNFVLLNSDQSGLKCTAVPVDDSGLVQGPGWSLRASSGNYRGTISQAKRQGASLRLDNIVADRVGILAMKCPGCGVFDVFLGTTFLKRFNLNATTTKKKQVLLVPAFSTPDTTGNLVLIVASSGKPVRIDGVGVLNK